MADKKKLERNTEDKIIAGVASGVADFFGLDRSLVRVLWALAIFLGGFGGIIYIILWIVLPEAGQDRTVADDFRERVEESQAAKGADTSAEADSDDEADSDSAE